MLAAWAKLFVHEMPNDPAVTSTGSSKVTDRLASRATSVAPLSGDVDWTPGAWSGGAATVWNVAR